MNKAMKKELALILVVATGCWSGCAVDKNGPVAVAAGPPVATSSQAVSTNGTLLVYSAFRATADFNARDPDRPEYSDYRISTPDGKLLRRVHNNSGTILQEAVPVKLPPGKYHVMARANGHGFVTIPVMIESRQTTTLHLEGGSRPNESVLNKTEAVRLPDGQIVGWKSASGS